MTKSISKIKLYGPGIPKGLEILRKIKKRDDLDFTFEKAGTYIGEEADYEYIWTGIPTAEETLAFVALLDSEFSKCQCRYTISTSTPLDENLLSVFKDKEAANLAFTFVRLSGPSISAAISALNSKIDSFTGIKARAGVLLGDFDYAFEWIRVPSVDDITILLKEMDEVLTPTGVTYHIGTKSRVGLYPIPSQKADKRSERILRFV